MSYENTYPSVLFHYLQIYNNRCPRSASNTLLMILTFWISCFLAMFSKLAAHSAFSKYVSARSNSAKLWKINYCFWIPRLTNNHVSTKITHTLPTEWIPFRQFCLETPAQMWCRKSLIKSSLENSFNQHFEIVLLMHIASQQKNWQRS